MVSRMKCLPQFRMAVIHRGAGENQPPAVAAAGRLNCDIRRRTPIQNRFTKNKILAAAEFVHAAGGTKRFHQEGIGRPMTAREPPVCEVDGVRGTEVADADSMRMDFDHDFAGTVKIRSMRDSVCQSLLKRNGRISSVVARLWSRSCRPRIHFNVPL